MYSVFNVDTMVQNNAGSTLDTLEELSIDEQIEALKTLFTVFYIKYHIDGSEEDKLRVWTIINMWVNTIGPVKFESRVLNTVAENVKFRIWDKPIPVDIVEEILDKSVKLKMRGEGLDDLARLLSELLSYLSGYSLMNAGNVVKEVCEYDSDCALSIAVQTMVIASNI